MGHHDAHFVEHCPQFFSVFEMRIVANKKPTPRLNKNCRDKRKLIFTMNLMPHYGRRARCFWKTKPDGPAGRQG